MASRVSSSYVPSLCAASYTSRVQVSCASAYIQKRSLSTGMPPVDKNSDDWMSIKSKYDGVVLGGTFDRFHEGHERLLGTAAKLARKQFTCGVVDGPMIEKKLLCELIQPIDVRIENVCQFVRSVNPDLSLKVVPITDPFGPSIVDDNLQCIVVSPETVGGGEAVNRRRLQNNLPVLDVHVIEYVLQAPDQECEDGVVHSSHNRKKLLGTLLKAPTGPRKSAKCYVIGLTGGIASGKSHISEYLSELGATVVDCDKLGHHVYEPNTSTYHTLCEEFGASIVNGQIGQPIDRRVLGGIVFGDPIREATDDGYYFQAARTKLNNIVWPRIADLAREQINNASTRVVVVDAAVMIEAGWHSMVDEIWLPIVPRVEAIKRIKERNQLSDEQAAQRVDAQMSNHERVQFANVVFCSLWEYDYTRCQVARAFRDLMKRIDS